MIRCYNCGLIGHKTQFCPSYGPRYPEPGKTSQDYGDEAQRIANLFAADIIREHEGLDLDDGEEVGLRRQPAKPAPRNWRISDRELAMRTFTCEFCQAPPSQRCENSTKSHRSRFHQAVAAGLITVEE